MNKWLKCICQACGLKSKEEAVEVYNRNREEHHDPEGVESHPEHVDSNENSPTLSASSPYIPISECITGKPIVPNDSSSASQETGYCNTTFFPFPPRVNWATHPIKPESETTPSPSQVGPIAPPRPPKKKSSPTYAGNPVTPNAISSVTSSDNVRTLQTPSLASRTAFRYDKFHECEADLMGTYTTIDTNTSTNSTTATTTGDGKFRINPKGNMRLKEREALRPDENGSGVEYRLIDHVKTQALREIRQERDEHWSRPTKPTTKALNNT